MNSEINLMNTNTPLAKRVFALYEAMRNAGDEDLVFEVVDHIISLANYASFVAKQEALIQRAHFVMDVTSYRLFRRSVEATRDYTFEKVVSDVNALNRMSQKYGVASVAEDVLEAVREEEANGNTFASVNSPSYATFAKAVLDTYYTTGVAGTAIK